jgi:mRNA interferase RelE/StbE
MRYHLRYSSSAHHALKHLSREEALKCVAELQERAEEPDPRIYVKRLQGAGDPPFNSLRIGHYRAVMSIPDEVMIIHVIDGGHRGSVYRKV